MDDLELSAGEKGDVFSQAEKLLAINQKSLMSPQDIIAIKQMALREYMDYKKQVSKVMLIKDWQAVDIVLGCVCAHFVEGEPLWVRIVGASRSGRTELLRAVIGYGKDVDEPDVVEVEALTPASIRGGLQGGQRLLDRIKGKLVITKDFAVLLTTRPEVRREIAGLSRSLKDGSLTADFGTEEGHVHQEGQFDWIIATTPVFEAERSWGDLLGARYVDLQWHSDERIKITRRAVDQSGKLKALRIALQEATRHFLDWIKYQQVTMPAPMPDSDDLDFIADLADVTALLRSPVNRDRHHDLVSMPMPEVGTDIAQSFVRLSQGLWLLGIRDGKPYLWRMAKDCIPTVRRKIVGELLSASQEMTAYTIAQRLQIPETTALHRVEDLQILGIADKASSYFDRWGREASFWKLNPDIKSRLENFKAKVPPAKYT